ncbi:Fic/DOC family protein [Dyadobacter jiangsuensis]|uniref:Fic/DOC family protein n=1 Tax=Dyadobacter jiangsuensis TaxID=1591085 RepID=A0A2P8FNN5_9BACT|nr:Fic/DOC family N-terminal domain-containing protein [Dyadobacter jiangsuensis]PSL23275.1 Fic/DOC family protein [Dyadobacter jiangsuensis]
MIYKISPLPLDIDLETKAVLKKVTSARSALAELKGSVVGIPNETILINTLSLQEAKDSSAIENIVTTQDELYQFDTFAEKFKNVAAKEVHTYAGALRSGFEIVRKAGFLSNNHILEIQGTIEANNAGFRRVPGTLLKNDLTGETVYMPPQSYDEIVDLMSNLKKIYQRRLVKRLGSAYQNGGHSSSIRKHSPFL